MKSYDESNKNPQIHQFPHWNAWLGPCNATLMINARSCKELWGPNFLTTILVKTNHLNHFLLIIN
jgi:hypothetical protein